MFILYIIILLLFAILLALGAVVGFVVIQK